METILEYLNDSNTTSDTAVVVDAGENEFGQYIILDSTIFYPQGGGQPCDTGSIGNFTVNKVVFSNTTVLHYGNGEVPTIGQHVDISIDADRRWSNSMIHTAGHLLDVAMMNCGFNFPPTKGYHFPDSPYVEYHGVIEPEKREETKRLLNSELERLIGVGSEIRSELVHNKNDLKTLCPFVPDYIPEDKPTRVVTVVNNIGCPCGGTHINNINELGKVEVHRIKVKSGNTRVSYRI